MRCHNGPPCALPGISISLCCHFRMLKLITLPPESSKLRATPGITPKCLIEDMKKPKNKFKKTVSYCKIGWSC